MAEDYMQVWLPTECLDGEGLELRTQVCLSRARVLLVLGMHAGHTHRPDLRLLFYSSDTEHLRQGLPFGMAGLMADNFAAVRQCSCKQHYSLDTSRPETLVWNPSSSRLQKHCMLMSSVT
jgi:hypothetical protein